jgi:hypothetical protein
LGRTALIVLALALLIGSAAAFTRSERLKLERSPVAKPKFDRHFSPTCDCARATAKLSILLRGPERLDVSVVDLDGRHVATLAEAKDLEAGRASFEWDGRNDEGQVVPDGRYRLKVRLERDRRTILLPKTVVVDTTPPTVRVVEATQTADGLVVRYRASEPARASLLRDGKPVARSEAKSSRAGRITWQPTGAGPTAGSLTVVAVDRAGNRSAVVPVVVAS